MKEYTEEELRSKAEAYCSAAEHCASEVEEKLRRWGAREGTVAGIVLHLEKERYLDAERYCRAYVRDKYRFAGWGRMKIVQQLRMKQLPAQAVEAGLDAIDETEYAGGLEEALRRKNKSLVARNDYERQAKLLRFAVGRGFSADEALQALRHIGHGDCD